MLNRTISATLAIVAVIAATLAIVAVMSTSAVPSSDSGVERSVSPIRSAVVPSTWRALGSPSGGEVVSPD